MKPYELPDPLRTNENWTPAVRRIVACIRRSAEDGRWMAAFDSALYLREWLSGAEICTGLPKIRAMEFMDLLLRWLYCKQNGIRFKPDHV